MTQQVAVGANLPTMPNMSGARLSLPQMKGVEESLEHVASVRFLENMGVDHLELLTPDVTETKGFMQLLTMTAKDWFVYKTKLDHYHQLSHRSRIRSVLSDNIERIDSQLRSLSRCLQSVASCGTPVVMRSAQEKLAAIDQCIPVLIELGKLMQTAVTRLQVRISQMKAKTDPMKWFSSAVKVECFNGLDLS